MPTRPIENQLLDLLERWDEARRAGSEITPEALCVGCPELVDELRRRIVALESFSTFMAASGSGETTSRVGTSSEGDHEDGHTPSPVLEPAVTSYRDLQFHARGGLGEV